MADESDTKLELVRREDGRAVPVPLTQRGQRGGRRRRRRDRQDAETLRELGHHLLVLLAGAHINPAQMARRLEFIQWKS